MGELTAVGSPISWHNNALAVGPSLSFGKVSETDLDRITGRSCSDSANSLRVGLLPLVLIYAMMTSIGSSPGGNFGVASESCKEQLANEELNSKIYELLLTAFAAAIAKSSGIALMLVSVLCLCL
jgi:hypothetical protein